MTGGGNEQQPSVNTKLLEIDKVEEKSSPSHLISFNVFITLFKHNNISPQ